MNKNIYVNHYKPKWDSNATDRVKTKVVPKQLTLWNSPQSTKLFPDPKKEKPQISSIPGASIKEKNRYRVQQGDVLLGDRLDIDAALKLAKKGES